MQSVDAMCDEVKVQLVPKVPKELIEKLPELYRGNLPFVIANEKSLEPTLGYTCFPPLNKEILELNSVCQLNKIVTDSKKKMWDNADSKELKESLKL